MLENKLGITDSAELARAEEKISKEKALKLFETGYLDRLEAGTYDSLARIHKYLFDEIYEFAGEIRKVNLAKGNFRFASVMYLEAALENIDKDDYLLAMERSPIKDIEIKYLLKNALTDQIQDREVYIKGIDHSYYYEGYAVYKTEDLSANPS